MRRVFVVLWVCALLCPFRVAHGEEAERCAFLLAHIAEVYDRSDTALLVWADWEADYGSPLLSELLRLHQRIEQLRRDNGVNDPGIVPLIATRKALLQGRSLLDIAVPIPVLEGGASPFQSKPSHFHRVNPPKRTITLGSAASEAFPQDGPLRSVRLTKPFEISDLITQAMWARVFGHNPSKYDDEGVFRVGRGQTARLVSLHRPVEKISFWSTLVFANRVSRLEGRRPAYDLSQMEFAGVPRGNLEALEREAARGTLGRTSGNFTIDRTANGYRLPTEAQWEYVARGGEDNPHFRAAYSFGDDASLLGIHAWSLGGRGSTLVRHEMTQRIATRKANPLGASDMVGNVGEWVEDAWSAMPPGSGLADLLAAPDDPLVLGDGDSQRVQRGSWRGADSARSAYRWDILASDASYVRGFRLVRTPE